MYMNFMSTYSDKKSCHTSKTLQTTIAQFVSDSWASCWSRGHLHMSVVHLAIKFGAGIFIQSAVIYIFPKFMMAISAILHLLWEPRDHLRRLIRGAYPL